MKAAPSVQINQVYLVLSVVLWFTKADFGFCL